MSRRLHLMGGATLIALFGCAGCSVSTGTPEALADAIVGYLAADDFDGYMAETVMTGEEGLELCPKADAFEVDTGKFRDGFRDCLKEFDFTGAKVESVNYKIKTTPANNSSCGNAEPVNEASEIEVSVTADGGKYTFEIDDVVETLRGWRQTDDLRCH